MGLDVYLYKYKDFDETRRKEKQYDEYSESLYAGRRYADILQEEREKMRIKEEEFKLSIGLNNEDPQNVEFPSLIHPNHQFKVGYFRSSYNDSGINRILATICGKTLDDIFQSTRGEMYYIKPDWEKALYMTDGLITELNAHVEKVNVSVSSIDMPPVASGKLPTSTNEALTVFLEEFLRGTLPFDGAYSNSVGLFSLKNSQRVKAFIPGLQYGRPCIFIVHEAEGLHWYIEALEVVKETIEHVLAQPDKEKYYLHWSA